VSIWAGTSGKLDVVPVEDVQRFEREFLDFLHREHAGILDGIRESRDFSDDTRSAVEDAYNAFLGQFETGEGKSLKAGHEEFEAMDHEDVEQEQIVRQKRG
jgi:F-type H+-transporting ATPase subunit alpha